MGTDPTFLVVLIATVSMLPGLHLDSPTCPVKRTFKSYVNGLFCLLSSRHVQVDKFSSFHTSQPEDFGKSNRIEANLTIDANNYNVLLNRLQAYDLCLEEQQLSTKLVEDLDKLFGVAFREPPAKVCLPDEGTVRITGTFVKLESIPQCEGMTVKLIEIFAIDTVFFYENLPVAPNSAPINIIAPKWSYRDDITTVDITGNVLIANEKTNNSKIPNRRSSDGLIVYERNRNASNFIKAFMDYRNYLRDNLEKPIFRQRILNFLTRIEQSSLLRADYGVDDFLQDAKVMDNYHYKLFEKVNFFPFFDGLMVDLKNKVNSSTSKDDRGKLKLMYAAVLSRSCSDKNNDYRNLVIDLKDFASITLGRLNMIQGSINESLDFNKTLEKRNRKNIITQNEINVIKEHNKDNNQYFQSKIVAARAQIDLFQKEMDEENKKFENETLRMQKEVAELTEKGEEYKNELKEKEKQLEKNIELGKKADALRTASAAISWIPFVGSLVSAGLDAAASVVESEKTEVAVDPNKAKEFKRNPIDEDALKQMQTLANGSTSACDKSKPRRRRSAATDQDVSNLDNVKKQEGEIDKNVENLQNLRDNVCKTVGPLVNSVTDSFKNATGEMKDLDQIQLMYKNWQMKDKLQTITNFISNSYGSFKASEEIVRSLQKLSAIMDCVTEIFLVIDEYKDHLMLGDVVAKVQLIHLNESIEGSQKDESLNTVLHDLNIYFKTNLIKMEYKRFVNALKQYSFPQAGSYLDVLARRQQILAITDEDTETLIKNIAEFHRKLVERHTTITNLDEVKRSDIYFGQGNVPPFFIWNHTASILKILKGEEVILMSALQNTNWSVNAMKFNLIDLKFRIRRNISAEIELRKFLEEGWTLAIAHLGNSYYNCAGKTYVISTPTSDFNFTFGMKNSTHRIATNEVYEKIQKGDYVLSPFTTWKVQISNKADLEIPDHLKEMANVTEIELVGRGEYIEANSTVCPVDMDKHYNVTTMHDEDPQDESFSQPCECVIGQKPAIEMRDGFGGVVEEISFQHFYI